MKSKVTRNEIIFQGTFNLGWHLRARAFNRNKQSPFVWEFQYLIPKKTDTIFADYDNYFRLDQQKREALSCQHNKKVKHKK